MSEIEKMFENAGIEPDCTYLFLVDGNGQNEAVRTMSISSKKDLKRLIVDCGVKGKVIRSTNTPKPFYPPFTAEKQLELIKWLCKSTYRNYLLIRYNNANYYWQIECNMSDSDKTDKFSECVASIINNLWQDLTEEEKEEIRGILQ